MKYLHLIDDTVFTDFAIRLFETGNPGNNVALIGIKSAELKPRHAIPPGEVILARNGSKEYYDLITSTPFDVLVVHALCKVKQRAVITLEKEAVIVWLAWGMDIYNTKFYKGRLYQQKTRQLLDDLGITRLEKIKDKLRNLLHLAKFGELPSRSYKKAVARVNFCAPIIADETAILQQLDFFHAQPVSFSYESIDNIFAETACDSHSVTGNNILIGNSTAPESNHLDVLEKLRDIKITNRKLILPLNYGQPLKYKQAVIQAGKKYFEDDFQPLLEYLSKEEYVGLLKSCSVAIMNHDRQQGLGNLIALLWLGCKLFMSEESVVFRFLKRSGFHVYSVQTDLTSEALTIPLSPAEKQLNRELLSKEYSQVAVTAKVMILIDKVSESSLLRQTVN